MKIHLLALTLSILIPISAAAQGTVSFQTSSANHVVYHPWYPDMQPGIQAALFWGPLGTPAINLIQLGAATGVSSVTGFLINGGTRTTGTATPGGANATFQVRAWYGGWPDWATAEANSEIRGWDIPFTNPTGNPFSSPPGTSAQLTGWVSYPLQWTWVIPEPSSLSLAGLAIAGLFVFRRKRG